MKGVIVSSLSPYDEPKFIQYITETHHARYILNDQRYRHWQFTNILVAHAKDKIIGHLGYRDSSYWCEKEMNVRVSMNLFVRPEFRSFGIGALLMSRLTDTDSYVLGSAYTEAVGVLISRLRPQWKFVGNMRRFLCFLNPHPIFTEFGTPNFLQSVSSSKGIELVSRVTEEFDDFWNGVRHKVGFTAVRNSTYLNWRFFNHPHFTYKVVTVRQGEKISGYLVYRIEKSDTFLVARIVDMVTADHVATNLLLSSTLFRLQKEGVHAVDFIMSGYWYDNQLCEAGFFDVENTPYVSFPILFSPLSLKRVVINVGYDCGLPFNECYFTKADSDQDRPNPL